MRRIFQLLLLAVLLAVSAAGAFWWWASQPLSLAAEKVEMTVPPGASLRTAARKAVDGGVRAQETLLYAYFRLTSNPDQTIKPGDYEITRGMTPQLLLDKLVRGDRIVLAVTLVEGWNFKQVRAALARAEHLRQDTRDMSPDAIMKALGLPGVHPEGRFFPDTYNYTKNTSDLAVMRQSLQLMDKQLAAAWEARAPGLPLKSPADALILASIIEKETGVHGDRPEISGVFINRLNIGMRLQTDPTVIYGLGDRFDGNLRRVDLTTDTPWNTYTRAGLPPTPIAMPGRASLIAAVQPASTRSLYFVARGDGSSHFSGSLDEHNRAVNKYQRGNR